MTMMWDPGCLELRANMRETSLACSPCVRDINVVPTDWICRIVFCSANLKFESLTFATTMCIARHSLTLLMLWKSTKKGSVAEMNQNFKLEAQNVDPCYNGQLWPKRSATTESLEICSTTLSITTHNRPWFCGQLKDCQLTKTCDDCSCNRLQKDCEFGKCVCVCMFPTWCFFDVFPRVLLR